MSEIHDAGTPACPGCGQGDHVAAVPVVYLAGRQRQDVRTAAVAAALEPGPSAAPGAPGFAASFLAVLLGLGGSAAVIVAFAVGGGDVLVRMPAVPSPGPLCGGLLFAASVALMAVAGLRRRRVLRHRRAGRMRAERVWERGWYCGRCGTAHFRPAADVPAGAVQLGDFRRLVWGAGGYGDLVAKNPVA